MVAEKPKESEWSGPQDSVQEHDINDSFSATWPHLLIASESSPQHYFSITWASGGHSTAQLLILTHYVILFSLPSL